MPGLAGMQSGGNARAGLAPISRTTSGIVIVRETFLAGPRSILAGSARNDIRIDVSRAAGPVFLLALALSLAPL